MARFHSSDGVAEGSIALFAKFMFATVGLAKIAPLESLEFEYAVP